MKKGVLTKRQSKPANLENDSCCVCVEKRVPALVLFDEVYDFDLQFNQIGKTKGYLNGCENQDVRKFALFLRGEEIEIRDAK